MKIVYRKSFPHLVALIVFLMITYFFFQPLFQGKEIRQVDKVGFRGMSKEIVDFREQTGKEPLWTNSLFGGMPANQISVKYDANKLNIVSKILRLNMPRQAGTLFLYFAGFYFLLIVLGVNPWLAIIGAIAYGFSSYFIIILQVGHNTKALAIAYMAPIFAGIILTYKGRVLLGSVLTAIFMGIELTIGHPQITYYLLLIIIIYGLFKLYESVKAGEFKKFAFQSSTIIIGVLLAVLSTITYLWMTYEYSKETERGKVELAKEKKNRKSGLDIKYATQWSYGVDETLTLLVPNYKGGSTERLGSDPKLLRKISPEDREFIKDYPIYWGNMESTAGPVYVGAVVFLLFIIGMIVLRGWFKWAVFTAIILSIMLSWGRNFMPLTDFFFAYVPFYNKFRAVSMTLVIAEFGIPIIAFLGLNELIKNPELIQLYKRKLLIAFGVVVLFTAILTLIPEVFTSFESNKEADHFAKILETSKKSEYRLHIANIQGVRKGVLQADALRTLVFLLLTGGFMALYYFRKIKYYILIAGIALLVGFDLIPVSLRYLNKSNFVESVKMEKPFNPSFADSEILKDTDPDFRVLNLTVKNVFSDPSTSYFHKSIGGYHAAKLRRYQDLIENKIQREVNFLKKVFESKNLTPEKINDALSRTYMLNMLNTKYIIVDPNKPPIYNANAMGNAWFVKGVAFVQTVDDEMQRIGSYKSKKIVIVHEKFKKTFYKNKISFDKEGEIVLQKYSPNYLRYRSKTDTVQLAFISEIYYQNGWNAYIDGIKSDYIRANYVFRAMIIPEGNHVIEFKFEPKSFYIGEKISLISSIFLIILLIAALIFEYNKTRNRMKPENEIQAS